MSRADRVLGGRTVTLTVLWLTRKRLRVVAYHGVPDRQRFDDHLDYFQSRFHVVTGARVASAIEGVIDLPDRALWLTFDDGQRSVVHNGLPSLLERGMSATAFVCPGLIDSVQPFWWSVVEAALAKGPLVFEGLEWTDRRLVTRLKMVPDDVRRTFIAGLEPPERTADPPMNEADLDRWLTAGMEVGNHTWDHPCLPMCTAASQAESISRAQSWLAERLRPGCQLFAYPNGDEDSITRQVVAEADFDLAVCFDHRIVSATPDPLAISRLRLDADAELDRVRAITSGAHSGLFHVRSRLRRERSR